MSKRLPQLRPGLDIFPSPVPERPGLLLRDPFRYTEEILIIPPLLVHGLLFLDGERTEIDLQAELSRLVGQIVPGEVVRSFVETLKDGGFLETEEFDRLRELRHHEFAAADLRQPAHSGSAYPADDQGLASKLNEYLGETDSAADGGLIGIAAPHVSPEGGWQCYAAAYNRLRGAARERLAEKTVVLLGTSHYGAPERFGLTRKPFVTPLGQAEVDTRLVNWLEARGGDAVISEDYCHAIEHSLEFQVVFLRQILGPGFKILPILCGPFVEGLFSGKPPETDDRVNRFLQVLGEMAERHREELFWVLGIDLAHIGRRYGDATAARAEQGYLGEVRELDAERLDRVCVGDGAGFFELVKPEHDRLRWCGFSPLYTFLKAMPGARGDLLRYDQWNIDEQSVVSFAALELK